MSSVPNGLIRIIGGVPVYAAPEPYFDDKEFGDGRSPHPGRQLPPVGIKRQPFFSNEEFSRRG